MNKRADIFENVAPIVCNKPEGISHSECLTTFGAHNPLCRDYGKCRLYEKTYAQFEYVLHPINQDSFLRACPGSGKTEVVGMKAAYEIRQWDQTYAGIAVLTFTNNAADVIHERVNQFAGLVGYPHFIGTFDSWLHGYLANPFAHTVTGYTGRDGDHSLRVIDVSSQEDWLNAYRCKTPFVYNKKLKDANVISSDDTKDSLGSMPIFANNLLYDSETCRFIIKPFPNNNYSIDHLSYFETDAFQKYIADKKWLTLEKLKEDLNNYKRLFLKAGFVNYQDVEGISLRLLHNTTIRSLLSQRYPMIIVDECQDLSWGQLKILGSLQKQGSRVHLVGDINQAIYAFKKVNPENIVHFVDDGNFRTLALQNNFRSVQPIVDLCARLVDQGNVIGVPSDGKVPACVYFIYDPKNIMQLVDRFEAYLQSRSITAADSVILSRGHATVNKLRSAASNIPSNPSIALATAVFLWSSAGLQGMDESLKCIGRFIATKFFPGQSANSRHHYCPDMEESVIKWRLFLARVLDACAQNEAISNIKQTWDKWAKTVRANFVKIVTDAFHGELPDRKDFTFTALKGESNTKVITSLETTTSERTESNIRITTIHQAKGETFEAALVVSSPTSRGDGGHWRQWLDKTGGDGEHTRFAYVASSRPRKLLAWAIPKDDESSYIELENLGFIRGELPP